MHLPGLQSESWSFLRLLRYVINLDFDAENDDDSTTPVTLTPDANAQHDDGRRLRSRDASSTFASIYSADVPRSTMYTAQHAL